MEESAESLIFGIGRILAGRDLDATVQTIQELWGNREQALAPLKSGGNGGPAS